jgi:hypothetical protein
LVSTNHLVDTLARSDVTRKDKLLALLAHGASSPVTVGELKNLAESQGLREIEKWNVSAILGGAKREAARLKEGWVLTTAGKEYITLHELGPTPDSPVKDVLRDLRAVSAKINDLRPRQFVDEAIRCLEAGCLRAGIVFSWVGAVAVLHEHVFRLHLASFNAEAKRRDPKSKEAKSLDDLGLLKEHDFLDILQGICVLDKNTKQQLQRALELRNSQGHPTSLAVGERQAAAHVELLILNAYSRF